MSKTRIKKGIDSIDKQISLHKEKLRKARGDGNIGLADYYEKELEHFEAAKERMKKNLLPKQKRKK